MAARPVRIGPYEDVTWHGADGGDVGNQTPAIQEAIDALETTGGTVFIPSGTYRMVGSLEMHDNVSLLGEGPEASILSWPTSLGAGSWAITPDLTTGYARFTTISNLGLVGPGSWDGETYGAAVSDMNGLKISAQQGVHRCEIGFFHRGCGILEDHSWIFGSIFGANTYNLAWLSGSSGSGDHHIYSSTLTGATIASVYVENSLGIAGAVFNGSHMGFAPYGILGAAGRVGNLMYGALFLDSHIEAFGTAAIWGPNTTDHIIRSRWICSSVGDQVDAMRLPATTYDFVFRAGTIQTSVFDCASCLPSQEPATAYFSTSGSSTPQLYNRFEMVPPAVLRSNTAAFLHRAAGGEPTYTTFTDAEGVSGRFCTVQENPIVKGNLVKMYGGNSCTVYDDDTLADAPLGVALQSGGVDTIIAVATEGYLALLVAGGTITGGGRFLKPAATNGRVVQASSWSDGPIVGVSMGGASTGDAFEVHVRCGVWG